MTGINLDSAIVREVVAKGLIESLDEEQRTLILAQAVEFLLTPPPTRNTYDPVQPSPLAYAFQEQLRAVAGEVVRDYLSTDAVREQIVTTMHAKMREFVEDQSFHLQAIGWAAGERFAEILRGEHR